MRLKEKQSLTKEYFNKAALSWDDKPRKNKDKLHAIFQIAGVYEGARILDVACGTGVLFDGLLSYSPKLVRAIDISPTMVKMAQAGRSEENLLVSEQDFYTFDEDGFDFLFLYNAYPHFLDKENFSRQAYGCLKTGGRLIIAHGAGRDVINGCHNGAELEEVSTGLASCTLEAKRLADNFDFDIMVDTTELYILSGVKKGKF